ncbi:MAG: hypothetical protein ACRYGR_08130, partial [Janthinobacterium lividum]
MPASPTLPPVSGQEVVRGLRREASSVRELPPQGSSGDGCIPSELQDNLTKPGKRLGTGTFRLSTSRVLLTYSQVPEGWSVEAVRDALELLGATYRIGKELHQDGGVHYHCYVD